MTDHWTRLDGRTRSIATFASVLAFVAAQVASAGALSNLFVSNLPAVGQKIAEFSEEFVVGGIDFSADGHQIATNAMMDGLDVNIRDWRTGHIVHVLHKTAPAGEGNAIRFNIDGSSSARQRGRFVGGAAR